MRFLGAAEIQNCQAKGGSAMLVVSRKNNEAIVVGGSEG